MIEGKNPLWMENRPYNRIFLSLDMLQSNEEAYNIIRKIVGRNIVRRLARTEADPLDENYMNDNIEEVNAINMTELWNAFKAQGNHLFAFIKEFCFVPSCLIKEYPYKRQHTLGELIIIYCQMVTLHSNELRITDDYDSFDKIEYALIYAN